MSLNASEIATLNFYNWEILGRGYSLFPHQVNIEPPFIPFKHYIKNYPRGYDDGRAPTIFNRVSKFFKNKKNKSLEYLNPYEINAQPFECLNSKVALELQFSKPQNFNNSLNIELLQSLCFSEQPISFELIGTESSIIIQIVCSLSDKERIEALYKSYFPSIIITQKEIFELPFSQELDIAICDFGLESEFIRPIKNTKDSGLDSLKNIFATLEYLRNDDVVMLQVMFKGVDNPWAKNVLRAVNDGNGNSFFVDAPEMLKLAKIKTKNSLCAVTVRIAIQSTSKSRIKAKANEMMNNIAIATKSSFNKLIPLSNEGYDFNHHVLNLYTRETNRLGMLLNVEELSNLVHYPNSSIHTKKLNYSIVKTKAAKNINNQGCLIGLNQHQNELNEVRLSHEQRLKHTHVIGATGTGKSTLLVNMILEDISKGIGAILIDPHGDITDDVLMQIPENRKQDVVLIDPSDTDFPIGFNLLEAKTDIEKVVLSSDLVSAFKQHATAWGDNMTAVLTNAINTFLENPNGGTIIELKRFLLEDNFRANYLKQVEDASLNYYWTHEYKMVKKGIAPLLTRIDTFLRPKILKHMFAQNQGINFNQCLSENKIVLIKLAQGLIGEENSYLLGALFLSKINQAAYNRQRLHKNKRVPYYVYIDEFQNFITPSITSMLSGARKYGVGLILAHQELSQIEDNKTLNSVLSNPFTRICFRLGDSDAKKLEAGFSYFEKEDFLSLETGEAIVRLGSVVNDFNLKTSLPTGKANDEVKQYIIQQTRRLYCKRRKDVEGLINNLLPNSNVLSKNGKKSKSIKPENDLEIENEKEPTKNIEAKENEKQVISEKQKQDLIADEVKSQTIREHTYLQRTVKRLAQQHGYASILEKETKDGRRIDVSLENEQVKIACEISVTNTPQYELENIKKCLKENYHLVLMISKNLKHLSQIKEYSMSNLSQKEFGKVRFISPDDVVNHLTQLEQDIKPKTEIIKGYRVTTSYDNAATTDSKKIKDSIFRIFKK